MKQLIGAVIVAGCLGVAALAAPAKPVQFADHKAWLLNRLETMTTCVKAANNWQQLRSCRAQNRIYWREARKKRLEKRAERIEQRKERLQKAQ